MCANQLLFFAYSIKVFSRLLKMAGFDPSDIRSEMAAAGVGHEVATPPTSPSLPEQSIIPVIEEPVPLETIMPGDPGNAIDLELLQILKN